MPGDPRASRGESPTRWSEIPISLPSWCEQGFATQRSPSKGQPAQTGLDAKPRRKQRAGQETALPCEFLGCGHIRWQSAGCHGRAWRNTGISSRLSRGHVCRQGVTFSSCQHAHASVGMAPATSKVWAKEFAAATTQDGHTLGSFPSSDLLCSDTAVLVLCRKHKQHARPASGEPNAGSSWRTG